MQLSYLQISSFRIICFDPLTCNGEKGTPAMDTARPGVLIQDYKTFGCLPSTLYFVLLLTSSNNVLLGLFGSSVIPNIQRSVNRLVSYDEAGDVDGGV